MALTTSLLTYTTSVISNSLVFALGMDGFDRNTLTLMLAIEYCLITEPTTIERPRCCHLETSFGQAVLGRRLWRSTRLYFDGLCGNLLLFLGGAGFGGRSCIEGYHHESRDKSWVCCKRSYHCVPWEGGWLNPSTIVHVSSSLLVGLS